MRTHMASVTEHRDYPASRLGPAGQADAIKVRKVVVFADLERLALEHPARSIADVVRDLR
jgi:hypothetical protein